MRGTFLNHNHKVLSLIRITTFSSFAQIMVIILSNDGSGHNDPHSVLAGGNDTFSLHVKLPLFGWGSCNIGHYIYNMYL